MTSDQTKNRGCWDRPAVSHGKKQNVRAKASKMTLVLSAIDSSCCVRGRRKDSRPGRHGNGRNKAIIGISDGRGGLEAL